MSKHRPEKVQVWRATIDAWKQSGETVAEPMAEVVLRSGVVVRVPLAAAPEAVTQFVAAVGAVSC